MMPETLKPEPNPTAFDDLAAFPPGEESHNPDGGELRQTARLFEHVVTLDEVSAACRRVRTRLFSMKNPASNPGRAAFCGGIPSGIKIAAAVALMVTSLALFQVLPMQSPAATDATFLAEDTGPTLIFPGGAVMDARLARLELDLYALRDDALWNS